MFETVAPEFRNKRVAYETLPVSIALHAAAVAGAVVIAVWNVTLPDHSPRLIRSYTMVTSLDPPLPAAVKLAPLQPTPQLPDLPVHNPNLVLAPSVIPDTIPILTPARQPSIFTPAPAVSTVSTDTPGGSSDGIVGEHYTA